MTRAAGILAASALGFLSAIHVVWAAGGTVFKGGAIPTRLTVSGSGGAIFEPSRESTLVVAAGLAIAATVVLRAGYCGRGRALARIVGLAFAARAIGDFRYVGLTKRVRGTTFADRDSAVYVPICLCVSALSFGAAR